MKNKLIIGLCLLLSIGNAKSQVTIGTVAPPIEGALLDLKDDEAKKGGDATATKGLGLPCVELQDYNELKIGTETYNDKTAHIGLMVYNVADKEGNKKCDANYPTTGLYVWDGDKWEGINAEEEYKPNHDVPGPVAVYAPNSYIVMAGGSETIPVEKAFAIWDWWGGGEHPEGILLPETSAAFSANLSVAVLWEETEEGVIAGSPIIEKVSFDPNNVVTSSTLLK